MELSTFLQELQPYLAGSRRSGEYTRELLIQAVRDDYPVNGILYTTSEKTLRAYCNGTRMGSKMAKELIRFFEHRKFARYIDELPPTPRDGILDLICRHGISASIGSLGNDCADILYEALILAAQKKPGKQGQTNDRDIDRLIIEEALGRILNAMLSLDPDERLDELRYDAVRISEKLGEYPGPKANALLARQITRNVVEYYNFIQEQIGLLEGRKKATFKMAAELVQDRYIELKKAGRPAGSVFYDISNWIETKTKAGCGEACEILASFFIQNCEVFDAPAQ